MAGSEASSTFVVKLDDQITGTADDAAGALNAMQDSIKKDEQALKSLESAMRSMQKASSVNIQDFRSISSQAQAMRDRIARAKQDFVGLGGVLGRTKRESGGLDFSGIADAAKAATAFNPKQWELAARGGQAFGRASQLLGKSAQQAKAPVQQLGNAAGGSSVKLGDFKDAIEGGGGAFPPFIKDLIEGTTALGPFGLAISAAFAALGAIGIGVFGIGKLISATISAQEELEGMSQAAINVAKRSPIARTEIAKLSDELEKQGLKGTALEEALEKAVSKKFGKAATKSMMGLTVQIQKAKENATLLFTGVNTDPLLEGAAGLFKFLDASTVEGRALKTLIETLLNPIINGIGKAGPMAKQFFQGMIIGALQTAIAVLLVKKRIEDAIGLKLDLKAVDWTTVGQAVLFAAVAFGLVVGAIAVAVGWVGLMTGAALALGVAIVGGLLFAAYKVGEVVVDFYSAIGSLLNFFVSRAAAFIDAGANFALGVAAGIRSGISEVISAALEMASAPVDAVKQKLKIKSPSGLARDEVGYQIPAGQALGMREGIPLVENAASDLGNAGVPEVGGALGVASGSGARSLHIENLYVQGVEGADDPAFVGKMTEALERAAQQAGIL